MVGFFFRPGRRRGCGVGSMGAGIGNWFEMRLSRLDARLLGGLSFGLFGSLSFGLLGWAGFLGLGGRSVVGFFERHVGCVRTLARFQNASRA